MHNILVQSISDRGCPYIHMSVEEGQGRVLLKFLTDLIYCDTFLLSGVICSIGDHDPVDITSPNLAAGICLALILIILYHHPQGCATTIGFELILLQYFPNTFHHGVWTSRIAYSSMCEI